MKYLVQLKYTNPAHEHVSLRRRVDTINRIVEAASEEEAINRSARQQRALGFLIQDIQVFDEAAKDWKKAFQKVATKNLNKDLAAVRSNVHRLDKATKNHDDDVEDVKDKVRKGMKEEVEQVEEGIAADMLAAKREKKQSAVKQRLLDKEMQDRKIARDKARQAGTMGNPGRLKEDKANINSPKKAKLMLALNKLGKGKKAVNMEPSLDAEKK